METKYTKGPWIINYPDVNKYNAPFKIGNQAFEGNIINPLCEVSTDELYFDLDESEANAKLIAAAPELIKLAININESLKDIKGHRKLSMFEKALISRTDELIKKATQ